MPRSITIDLKTLIIILLLIILIALVGWIFYSKNLDNKSTDLIIETQETIVEAREPDVIKDPTDDEIFNKMENQIKEYTELERKLKSGEIIDHSPCDNPRQFGAELMTYYQNGISIDKVKALYPADIYYIDILYGAYLDEPLHAVYKDESKQKEAVKQFSELIFGLCNSEDETGFY